MTLLVSKVFFFDRKMKSIAKSKHYKLIVFIVSWPKKCRILSNSTYLRPNSIEFGQICRIRPNSTFKFGILNSKNQNSNEFEQIRPSLVVCFPDCLKHKLFFSLLFRWHFFSCCKKCKGISHFVTRDDGMSGYKRGNWIRERGLHLSVSIIFFCFFSIALILPDF